MIDNVLPSSNEELRHAIYAGKIFRAPPNQASEKLVARALELLEREFGTATPLRELQFTLPGTELYQRISKVRKSLLLEHDLVFEVMSALGFGRQDNALDPARLRAVFHDGHENPLAVPAYTAHRDTWYANPETQINWWIPLHDVVVGETFAFFPDYFDRAVTNNSEEFSYDEWMAKVGWQNSKSAEAVYPHAEESSLDSSKRQPFALNKGEILLFSAAHLHQTSKNVSGLTRFSMEFRTVHLKDHAAGSGAPRVDNLSKGAALKDYIRVQ